MELNHRPHAYQACALTIWAMSPYLEFLTMVLHLRAFTLVVNVPFFKSTLKNKQWTVGFPQESSEFLLRSPASWLTRFSFSLERRWSSRTFWYGYLVTTSPQSLVLPSTAASKISWLTGFGYSYLSWCDGRCVQGPGTYSRQYADLPLLAIPTSWRRISAFNPNWDCF